MDANPCEKESAMGNATAGLVQSPLLPIIHNHLHALHHGRMEMFRGQLVPCVEVPERVDHVLAELRQRNRQREPDRLDQLGANEAYSRNGRRCGAGNSFG